MVISKRYHSFRSWGVISLRNRRAFSSWLLSFGMVMFSPLSRLRRQLSQRESQVPRVMHDTERCIEVRPRYLFDKFRFAGLFGSIVSINYKNRHSSANCCACSLPYEHRPLAGDLFSGRSRGVEVYPRQGKSPLEHQKISSPFGGAFVRQLTERICADALRFFMLL